MIDTLLSRSALLMQGSAIRRIGGLMGQIPDLVSFAGGYPADEAFPTEAFREIAADVLAGPTRRSLQYGATAGYRPLREAIGAIMRSRGIDRPAGELIVTTGSQQGLDLLSRVILDPGDVVLLERPSYTGAILAFRNIGATMVGVGQDDDGIDLDDLARTAAAQRALGRRVKMLYVVPNFQNPAGCLLPRARRLALLEWALREEILLLEDDPYGELYFSDAASEEDTRPIAADDRDNRAVVYLSTFSKMLAPGFRVGWVSAPAALAARLEIAKQGVDLHSGSLDQMIVYEACRRGVLVAQGPKLRRLYQEKRDVMMAALCTGGPGPLRWVTPRGGFFLWAHLTPPLTSESLLTAAVTQGVIFVPGTAFHVDDGGQDTLRLSFAEPTPERIALGIGRLLAAASAAI